MPDDSTPLRYCDVVMKGGITSGVVYPLAVAELARSFRLVNIGGTSAGAIAAVLTAAAEHRRARGGGEAGFARLAELPRWLAAPSAASARTSQLAAMFRPDDATRPLFALVTALAGHGSMLARAARFAGAALRHFPVPVLAGAFPALLLLVLAAIYAAMVRGMPFLWWALGTIAVLAAFAAALAGGIVAGAGIAAFSRALRALPENGYGMCSGMAGDVTQPSLTGWLAALIDEVAGIPRQREAPLTFGDLWSAPAAHGGERGINLETMTASLTHGRPCRVPFDADDLLWKPDELARLFPPRIVAWMAARAGERPEAARWLADPERRGLLPLPRMEDLPVVVAARLSLSFPLLVSAVPLWSVDYSLTRNQAAKEEARLPQPERVWFSDGGIASNFPVHFFDEPLPRWPTFAVNLRPFHPDHPPGTPADAVWMPERNAGGILEWWTRIDEGPERGRLRRFLGAIVNTMQNWRDNAHLRVPGYRDRIVHISHAADEGGLNLQMPPAVVRALSERGRAAGRLLTERFAPTAAGADESPMPGQGWENHRWVRFRSTMAAVESMLTRLADAYDEADADGGTYAELLAREGEDRPRGYPLDDRQRAAAAEEAEKLFALVRGWEERGLSFAARAPGPAPELRIIPRV